MTTFQRYGLLVAAAAICVPGSANAAMITIDEAAMDAIFSQPSFGVAPIDIRFNAAITHVAPTLLEITDGAELASALSLFGPGPTVYMIFVDAIDFCEGVPSPTFVGCASNPGNHMVVESGAMASPLGGILGAHELGHNAGLPHVGTSGNLMLPALSGSTTTLTPGQASTVLGSAIEQFDTEAFISITPVLITAPEPSLVLLLLAGAAEVVRRRRR